MSINPQQYEKAASDYFLNDHQGKLNFAKYFSPTLLAAVVKEMQQSLPSVVAARLAFQRLVANGTIRRTDGRTEADDRAEAVSAAQANLDKAAAEVDARPLSREELEYFSSLGREQLSQLYYGDDGSALNQFAIRYNRAVREYQYRIPDRFRKTETPVVVSSEGELTVEEYNSMSAAEMQRRLRNPAFKQQVYLLIKSGKV